MDPFTPSEQAPPESQPAPQSEESNSSDSQVETQSVSSGPTEPTDRSSRNNAEELQTATSRCREHGRAEETSIGGSKKHEDGSSESLNTAVSNQDLLDLQKCAQCHGHTANAVSLPCPSTVFLWSCQHSYYLTVQLILIKLASIISRFLLILVLL